MKILKVLILSIVFFAAKETVAQNDIVVNNNTPESYSLQFDFLPPCPSSSFSAPAYSTSVNPYCLGGSLTGFTMTFTDNTCTPPQVITYNVSFTTNPTIYSYTRCDGTTVHYSLHFNGLQYILDIN